MERDLFGGPLNLPSTINRRQSLYRCRRCHQDKHKAKFQKGVQTCNDCLGATEAICSRCSKVKPIDQFRKKRFFCIDCENIARRDKDRSHWPSRQGAKLVERRKREREKRAAKRASQAERLSARRSEARAAREIARIEKAAIKAKAKQEARNALLREKPWLDQTLSDQQRYTLRYKLDTEFNLSERLRTAMRRKRQGIKLGQIMRDALKREGQSPTIEAFFGYTIAQLCVHIERQFSKDMTWQAFREGKIHIDHIVPLASFNLCDSNELNAAWALANLRPMWAGSNVAKGRTRLHLI